MNNNEQTVETLKSLMLIFPINLIETFQKAGRLNGDDVVELLAYAKAVGKAYDAMGAKFLARSYKNLSEDIETFRDLLIRFGAKDSDPEHFVEYLKKVI